MLDGVLIGAGDQRFLAAAMIVATFGVYAPAAAVVALSDGGVVALWGALSLWFVARAVGSRSATSVTVAGHGRCRPPLTV